jgi:hypothetical protein
MQFQSTNHPATSEIGLKKMSSLGGDLSNRFRTAFDAPHPVSATLAVITNGRKRDGRLSIRSTVAARTRTSALSAAKSSRIDTVLVTVMGEQSAGHRRELREIERDYPDGGPRM